MKLRSYGKVADWLGSESEFDVVDSCSVGELRTLLADAYPAAADAFTSNRVLVCVNDMIVPDSHLLSSGQQVDLLAPVSGG